MKKKLSYRDKLLELAYIYDVKEITIILLSNDRNKISKLLFLEIIYCFFLIKTKPFLLKSFFILTKLIFLFIIFILQ